MMRIVERNNIFRRPCGCKMHDPVWGFFRINIPTALRAWIRGRSYANYDGYLSGHDRRD